MCTSVRRVLLKTRDRNIVRQKKKSPPAYVHTRFFRFLRFFLPFHLNFSQTFIVFRSDVIRFRYAGTRYIMST